MNNAKIVHCLYSSLQEFHIFGVQYYKRPVSNHWQANELLFIEEQEIFSQKKLYA